MNINSLSWREVYATVYTDNHGAEKIDRIFEVQADAENYLKASRKGKVKAIQIPDDSRMSKILQQDKLY